MTTQTKVTAKEFLVVMFLEAIQNVPLVAGMFGGIWLWDQNLAAAVVSMVAGSVLSALSMIPTEGRIFEGHHESARAILGNIATFSILMFVFTAYIKASWSSYWTDIVGGLVAATALGTAQDLAAGERIGIARILALGLSCIVSLLIIRFTSQAWSPLAGAAIVTAWFTLAMGIYKLWRKRHPQGYR